MRKIADRVWQVHDALQDGHEVAIPITKNRSAAGARSMAYRAGKLLGQRVQTMVGADVYVGEDDCDHVIAHLSPPEDVHYLLARPKRGWCPEWLWRMLGQLPTRSRIVRWATTRDMTPEEAVETWSEK